MVNHAAASIVTRRLVAELLQPDAVAPYSASCRTSGDEIVRSGRGYMQRWEHSDHWIGPGAPRLGAADWTWSIGVEPPRTLVGRILMRRRWVRPGPSDSPARSWGSARKSTTQIQRPRGAVIRHMMASA